MPILHRQFNPFSSRPSLPQFFICPPFLFPYLPPLSSSALENSPLTSLLSSFVSQTRIHRKVMEFVASAASEEGLHVKQIAQKVSGFNSAAILYVFSPVPTLSSLPS